MPLIALQLAVHQASTLASPTKASQNNRATLRVGLRSARRACTWVRGKDDGRRTPAEADHFNHVQGRQVECSATSHDG